MSKALTVLAECVDSRNGKRFQPGDVFNPAPNPEQAKRLVKAGCLPEAAVDAAVAAETDAEKAADAKAADERAAQEKAAADAKAKADADAKAKAEAEAKKAAEKKA